MIRKLLYTAILACVLTVISCEKMPESPAAAVKQMSEELDVAAADNDLDAVSEINMKYARYLENLDFDDQLEFINLTEHEETSAEWKRFAALYQNRLMKLEGVAKYLRVWDKIYKEKLTKESKDERKRIEDEQSKLKNK